MQPVIEILLSLVIISRRIMFNRRLEFYSIL